MAPPKRHKLPQWPRMTGRVESFNEIHGDLVVRGDQFNNIIYVPDSQHLADEVSVGQKVVFLDRREGEGFKRSDDVIAPARVFNRMERGREPVLYVIFGMPAAKPVPAVQSISQKLAAALRRD